MGKVLISLIVPIYNVEKYLKVCLESIIKQTYNNIEIILVNDGSTDSSFQICKYYEEYDSRVILIDKKNEGLSSARQAGINKAKGEFFCTVDSDDYIEKDFVEKMYTQISKEESDICVCATRQYSKNSSKIYGFTQDVKSPVDITLEDIETIYNILLGRYHMSDSWNKIYRTDFVKNTEVEFSLSKEYNGTDLLFNHLLLLHLPKISIINEPLYNYQILENSRVRRKNKQLQKGFMIIISRIIKEVETLKYSKLINNQLSCLYVNFLRAAAQDVFNSGINSKELKHKFNEFQMENRKFLIDNPRLSLTTKHMDTFSLKLFCHFLNAESSMKLINYFILRQRTLKLLGKIQK
ncbi:glycosyltransferase family 2 protein [Peribacillus frigoritolerans]|uniref:glycosyltransferase family 2 protein n=1 Tax=Peribacillus frigoritolerans TaxID=450367 RepID=UPI003018FC96